MFRFLSKKQWILIFISLFIILAAYFILPVSIPLIIAFVTALFLNPVIRWMQFRFRFKRRLCVIIVFLLFLITISTSGIFIVTKAIGQLVNLTENAPAYITDVNNKILAWEADINTFKDDLPEDFIKKVKTNLKDYGTNFATEIENKFTIGNIASLIAKIPNYLVSILIYLIALFLFMLELPRLKSKAYEFMTEKTAEKVRFMNARLSYVVFGFLKAQFLVSIIVFIVCLIGLLIIAPNVAIIMSLIIWIVDFIPIIGSIVILGPWALYMLITGDVVMGTQLAVLAIILLTIRRTVEPKVMGRHIGLSPLATLIAMYLGLKLVGLIGFILGPLVVIAFNSAKEAGIIKFNFKI